MNGFLIFRLMNRVSDHFAPGEKGSNPTLAATIAFLFLVHPVQTGRDPDVSEIK